MKFQRFSIESHLRLVNGERRFSSFYFLSLAPPYSTSKTFRVGEKKSTQRSFLPMGAGRTFLFFFSGFFVILFPLSSVVFHFLTQFSIRCLLVLFYRFECFRKTLVVVGFIPIFFKSFIRFEYIQIIYKIYFYRFSNPLSHSPEVSNVCACRSMWIYVEAREMCPKVYDRIRKFATRKRKKEGYISAGREISTKIPNLILPFECLGKSLK